MDISVDDPIEGLPSDLEDTEIVLVHDSIENLNGGISVEATFSRFFESPLYTLRQEAYPDILADIEVREIKPQESLISRILRRIGLGRIREYSRIQEYQNWKPPRTADVVVTTGTRSQHVIHHPDQHRIHYFHTPARWLWNLSHGQYDGRFRLIRHFMLTYANILRTIDVSTSHRIEVPLVNSELVARRVQSYYDLDPDIIYPPIDTFEFDNAKPEDFYLLLSRITPTKRTKLAVRAFNDLDIRLKITGEPNDTTVDYAQECKQIADENIEFLGWVEEDTKHELLSRCRGLVYPPRHEDFGIPPIEAMASGKPVVGVDEGFTKFQIKPGENGYLFTPNVTSLRSAVERSEKTEWDPGTITEMARQYDIRRAHKQWMSVIRSCLGQS